MQKQNNKEETKKQHTAGYKQDQNQKPNQAFEKPERREEDSLDEEDDSVEQAPVREKDAFNKTREQKDKSSRM